MQFGLVLFIVLKFIVGASEARIGPTTVWICLELGQSHNQSVISCPAEQDILLHDIAVFLASNVSVPCHANQTSSSHWGRPQANPRPSLLRSLQKRCNGQSRCQIAAAILDSSAVDLRSGFGLFQLTYACLPGTELRRFPCGSTIQLNSDPVVSEQTNRTHPSVGSGYLASYGYPRFYRGDNQTCVWELVAQWDRTIQLTILDLSLRIRSVKEQRCQDVIQIREGLALLWEGCGDADTPLILLSKGPTLQVILRAESKNLYPKRGLLAHYTAVGCPVPSTPNKGYLVWSNASHAYFLCCLDHVFPDTGLRHRQLACLNGHRWDASVPHCVDTSAEYKELARGLLSARHNQPTMAMQQETSDLMTDITGSKKDSDYDWTFDLYVPVGLMLGLLVANVVVVLIVLHYRRQPCDSGLDMEERVPLRPLVDSQSGNAPGPGESSSSPRKGGTPV